MAIAETPDLLEMQLALNSRCIDLNYLNRRTKSDPKLMLEMIGLYLEQTPPLIQLIKQSWVERNWNMLGSAIHKIIPSFLIVGINSDFEVMAKKIQEFAASQTQVDEIYGMVLQIEKICIQACIELEEEITKLKNNH